MGIVMEVMDIVMGDMGTAMMIMDIVIIVKIRKKIRRRLLM
jgi:hypothetical protein